MPDALQLAMHKLTVICALLVPIFAVGQNGGQVTVISGYASNRVQVPGVHALAGVPLVNTPSVTLDAAPLAASNGPFATLTWYGPGAASAASVEPSETLAQPQRGNFMNLGVAISQSSKGVAQLMAEEQVNRQVATRVYTNGDLAQLVQRLNQNTGLVKYRDKTEYLY